MVLFTLEEARVLLPVLRQLLAQANDDLDNYRPPLKDANEAYDKAENGLEQLDTRFDSDEGLKLLRHKRADFQTAIDRLSEAQKLYLERVDYWVDRITDKGVILRDLREGLLDFPAKQGVLEYFLCWKSGEEDIDHWHLTTDGFVGRKPLATLEEYF